MSQELAHTIKKFKIPLLLALNSHFLKVYQAMKPLSRSSKMKQILEKSALCAWIVNCDGQKGDYRNN